MGLIKNIPKDEKEPSFLRAFTREVHMAMLGDHLHSMNANALKQIADSSNNTGNVFQPKSLYIWLRTTLTLATCNALMESHSPFKTSPSLVDALWEFDRGLLLLLINVFLSITAACAYRGRTTVQNALSKYYGAEHDLEPDVSQMVKRRAATYRKYGIPSTEIGKFEIILLNVSTMNAIPTSFWLLCFTSADNLLIKHIRNELQALITYDPTRRSDGKRELSFDITKFESDCPLLVSSYHEAIRLTNAQVGNRRVMRDTTITDGVNHYLLKEGYDVQIPSGIAHLSPEFWGPDSSSFDSYRFMRFDHSTLQTGNEKYDERTQIRAYFPFGGGKHLCPERNFAFAEILGAVAVLVLGFDVKSAVGGVFEMPGYSRPDIGEAVGKPRGKSLQLGAKILRREENEDVVWKFVR